MRICHLLLVAIPLLAAPTLHADTTYTYTGNPFNLDVSSPTPLSVQGSFTVASPLAANSDTPFAPLWFSFSVGTFTLDSDTPNIFVPFYDDLTTDSSGNIVNWLISLSIDDGSSPAPTIYTLNENCCVGDGANTSSTFFGENIDTPGTWTETTSPVPEPTTLTLLSSGILALTTAIRRRVASR